MNTELIFALAADLLLLVHALIAAFVVFSLVFIIAGKLRAWSWVRNPWFRYAHLLAIAVVVLQSWLGVICPLTIWEMELRARAGEATYTGSFIGHWLETFLYYQAPDWVFVLLYTAFGLMVALSWWWVRPRQFRDAA